MWDQTFPAKTEVTHVVTYRVRIIGARGQRTTGYTLHTGASWKGLIGKAEVILKTASGTSLDQVWWVTPHANSTRSEEDIKWVFENFEPTKKDDIKVTFHTDVGFDDMTDMLKDEAETSWRARKTLLAHLKNAPRREGRELADASKQESDELRAALCALVEGIEDNGEQVIIPALGENNAPRPFAKEHSAYHLMDHFVDAILIANLDPDCKDNEPMLRQWILAMEALLEGRLFADGAQVTNAARSRDRRWRKELAVAKTKLTRWMEADSSDWD